MICQTCVTKLDEIDNFRQLSLEAEKMLQDFRTTLSNTAEDGEGKVKSFSCSIKIFMKQFQILCVLQLQVYVKDSQSQIIDTKISLPSEPIVPCNSIQRVPASECEAENRTVTRVNVSNGVTEETHQMPLQCTVPLKLNGTTTSVVPINVENISSLMQVVPGDEIPRIQQFKLPIQVNHFLLENKSFGTIIFCSAFLFLQTELALVSEPSNTRFSVSLPTVDVVSKENAVIQSLQVRAESFDVFL